MYTKVECKYSIFNWNLRGLKIHNRLHLSQEEINRFQMLTKIFQIKNTEYYIIRVYL